MNIFLAFSTTFFIRLTLAAATTFSGLFQDDETVPGTTEGILTIGIVIVLIIVVPIVWERRKWMR